MFQYFISLWSLWLRTNSLSTDGNQTQHVLQEKRHNVSSHNHEALGLTSHTARSGITCFQDTVSWESLSFSVLCLCVGFISRQVLPGFWQDHHELGSCLLRNLRGKGVPLSWYFPKFPGIFSTYSKWIMCQFRNQSLWPGGSNQLPLPEVVSGWEKCCYPKVSLSSQVRDGWWSSTCNKRPGCKEEF